MYPRRNQPRDDDSREVSGWIEGVTGAFDTDASIEDCYSESRDMEQDPSDLRGQQEVDAATEVSTEVRVGAKRGRPADRGMHPDGASRMTGRRIHDPYPDDALIIDGLANEELSKLGPDSTSKRNVVQNIASNQRRFSHWLQKKGRGSIGSRLTGSDEQQRSLQEDFREFIKDEGKKISVSFDRLRQYLGAESQLKQHDPYPDDALIIDSLAKEELSKLGPVSTSRKNASNQRKFSAWLRRTGRESIVSRLTGSDEQRRSLQEDFRAFIKDEGKKVVVSLDRLRQYLGAESQLKQHVPYPDDALMIDSFTNEELSKLGSDSTSKRRKVVLNLASNKRRFSDWLRRTGRESIASRLTGSDEQQRSLKDDLREFIKDEGKRINVSLDRLRQYLGAASQLKQHHPYPDDALMIDGFAKEELSKLGPDSTSQRRVVLKLASNQRRFSDWLQTTGRESIASRLNGSEMQKWSLKIDYQDFTEAVGSCNVSFKRLRQYQQVVEANAASGLSPEQASGREPAGLDGRSDPRAEFRSTSPLQQVDPSIEGRSGLSLDHTEWLGDQHIQTDYELLMQDLQRNDPDLAARTRLIDPLIAHYHLRLGDESTALSAFQRIVNDQNGRDTADFLFLPVSDASASDPDRRGTHWSLLLVDRRNREGPAAYHYDSFRGQNDEFAAMLAQRLGTRLEPVRMTQQRNDYDCGVFVVDGTRALVRRLARRDRPAVLHLDNLVADREQLQRRLSPAPNSARAGAAAAGPESSTQIADPAEFWHGVGQPGQLPDSWNTATFQQDLPSAAYSPVQSVNPPDAPWEQSLGASIFGTPQFMLPVEDLGGAVPASWQHGNQPVPDDLLPAMSWYELLPSADKPQTSISIHGVPYTATLGPSGRENDIYLFLQGW
ncbi:hypothetical protein CO657_24685 (plasmid) [Rhizobium acidisoli]|uniref:Ubiquitin-like protease family profile domain-containing protein n=2 Tax=Rhizobium acidisoli TaxID=1538158 RepID=A0AAE5WRF6_9HYPH|nr:hypothetical protein CO657_24685 [Rhizobium acidisoli]